MCVWCAREEKKKREQDENNDPIHDSASKLKKREREREREMEEERICRVCRGGEEEGNDLYHPCMCKGSISYVHKECLMTWLSFASRTKCELCGYAFKLSPEYAPNTPNTLPLKEMVLIALETVLKSLPSAIHLVLLCVSWIFSVPLATRYSFRMCVFKDLWGNFEEDETMYERLRSDWVSGVVLASALLVSCLAFVSIVDYVFSQVNRNDFREDERRIDLIERVVEENDNNNDNTNDEDDETTKEDREEEKEEEEEEEEEKEDEEEEDEEEEDLIPEDIEDDPQNAIELRVAIDELLGFRRNAFMFLQNITWAVMFIVTYMGAFVMMPMFMGVTTIWSVRNAIEMAYRNDTIVSAMRPTLGDDVAVDLGMFILGWTSIALSIALSCNILSRYNFVSARVRYLSEYIRSVIKVAWLLAMKILILPLLVGFTIDHAMLPIFGRGFKDMSQFFYSYPTCSLLLHWVGGVSFMLLITVLMLELNDMLHPDVLSHLIRLPDPNRHMLSILLNEKTAKHLKRMLVSGFVYFSCICLFLYVCLFFFLSLFFQLPTTSTNNSGMFQFNSQLRSPNTCTRNQFYHFNTTRTIPQSKFNFRLRYRCIT